MMYQILAEPCKNITQLPFFEVIQTACFMICIVRTRTTGFPTCVVTLHRYGVGFVWENQGMYNMNRFLCEFKQRLMDGYHQEWHNDMASRDRLLFYSSFKQSHSLAEYVATIKKAVLRKKTLIRFEHGVSPLNPYSLYRLPMLCNCKRNVEMFRSISSSADNNSVTSVLFM